MDFEIILAHDLDNGIGLEQKMPWRIKTDMDFFQAITMSSPDNVIIMGRITAESFPKQLPLAGRLNGIITSDQKPRKGFTSYSSLEQALNELQKTGHYNKVFVIGGVRLALEAVQHRNCRGVYLTKIHKTYGCDVALPSSFFERIAKTYVEDKSETKTVSAMDAKAKEQVALTFSHYRYVNHAELHYLNMMEDILDTGMIKETRNATTRSKFFATCSYDMDDGFPLITTRHVFVRGMLEELCFFLRGDTDAAHLNEKKVCIWNANTANSNFDMGPMYGHQFRHFGAPYVDCHTNYSGQGVDQLQMVIDKLVTDPHSRSILMTSFNPAQVHQGVLYPCHSVVLQFAVEQTTRISVIMYQRSCDLAIGKVFNDPYTAAFLHVVVELVNSNAQRTHTVDYRPGMVHIVAADHHVYTDPEKGNHEPAVRELLKRRHQTYPFPTLKIKRRLSSLQDLNDLTYEDFEVQNYIHGPIMKFNMVA